MKLKVVAISESGWAKVFIDDECLLSEPGTKTIDVDGTKSHSLTWFAQGMPGQTFKFQITEPDSEIWEASGTLKASGKATGQHII